MNKTTQKKVEELLEQTGHVLSVLDFDILDELNSLGESISGTTKGEARLLSEPFSLCGILFYPITVAKSLWYDEVCRDWEVEGSQQEALLFWLLTLPNVTGELDKYCDKKTAHKAIKRLSRKLHCSTDELTQVYKKCVGVKSKGGDSGADFGGLIDCLLREYNGTPEQWLYQTPLPMIETLMNEHAARINREAEATSKQSGGGIPPVASDRLRALKAFREKSNEILEMWTDG